MSYMDTLRLFLLPPYKKPDHKVLFRTVLTTLANPVFVVAFFHDRDQVWHVAILKKKNHGGK